jgi:hypothetical protein
MSCRTSPPVITGHSRSKNGVASARLRPVIHVLLSYCRSKTWMAGTSPAMTEVDASSALHRAEYSPLAKAVPAGQEITGRNQG